MTTIEAHQVFVVKRREHTDRTWCMECPDEQSMMVTPDEAAMLGGLSSRAIYRQIEAGTIHYQEPGEGLVLVCLNSLFAGATFTNLLQRGEES